MLTCTLLRHAQESSQVHTPVTHPRPHPVTHLELVGDQDACGVGQGATDAALKQGSPHVGVHSTQGVVQ
jgi:hypothetical protein